MDARDEVAAWLVRIFGILPNAADSAVARIEKIYTDAGYQIIHRDENHGPTMERCAKLADDPWAVTPSEHASGEHLCEGIAAAIRAMEVNHHG